MSTILNTQFGFLLCAFSLPSSVLWDIWRWKLDPYVTKSSTEEEKPFLTIHLTQSKEPTDSSLTLLREEYSGFFKRQVFRMDTGDTLWRLIRTKNKAILLEYIVSSKWDTITLVQDQTQTAGLVSFEYIGQMFPYCALTHNMLTFHGVLMEHEGRGIIVSAPSGTGKTTHARLWRDYRQALILNGDRASCYKKDGIWTGVGLPWSGSSGEQINRLVPIKAIVILERGTKNQARVLTGMEAFGAVLPHMQCPTWDSSLTNQAMDLLEDFMGQIPIIGLRCKPDVEAVEVLEQLLKEL